MYKCNFLSSSFLSFTYTSALSFASTRIKRSAQSETKTPVMTARTVWRSAHKALLAPPLSVAINEKLSNEPLFDYTKCH